MLSTSRSITTITNNGGWAKVGGGWPPHHLKGEALLIT